MVAAIKLCPDLLIYVFHADRAELLSLNSGHTWGGLVVHVYRAAQVCCSLLLLCAPAALSLLSTPLRLVCILVGCRWFFILAWWFGQLFSWVLLCLLIQSGRCSGSTSQWLSIPHCDPSLSWSLSSLWLLIACRVWLFFSRLLTSFLNLSSSPPLSTSPHRSPLSWRPDLWWTSLASLCCWSLSARWFFLLFFFVLCLAWRCSCCRASPACRLHICSCRHFTSNSV